ncbi:MAG: hypothetical protein LC647_00090, partial [Beggiatoa sp.]|nr:hypothetical protein [Beggiatoa sp.]
MRSHTMYRLAYCLSLAFLIPQAAAALGLGELKKHSELNQPFHATIDLVDANAEELDTLRVKLADAERFRRAGIERPNVLSQLRFEVVETGSGPDRIKITSQVPIQEPYLSFLIEVSWSNGRLFREYAALLDPPVYDHVTQRTTRPQGGAPNVARPAASGPRKRPSSSAARTAVASPGSYGPTVPGDTLWEIALRARSDRSLTVQQVMMALLRANPDAFFQDNVNALKAGAVLNMPDASVIAAVSRSEAVALMDRHLELWEQYRGRVAETTGRAPIGQVASTGEGGDRAISPGAGAAAAAELKLLAANTVGTGGVRSDTGGDSGKLRKELDVAQETLTSQKQEIGELSSKLAEADEIIKLLQRQIDVKDAALAALQARAAAPSVAGKPEAVPGATPPRPETGTPAAAESGAAVPDVPGAVAGSPPETASPQGADPAPPEAASQPEGSGEDAQTGAPLGTGILDTGTDGAGPGPGQAPHMGPTAGGVTGNGGADQAAPVASPGSPTAGLPEASPAVPAETPSAEDGGVLAAIPGGTTTLGLGIAIALILGSVAVAMRRKRAAEVAPMIDDEVPDTEPLPEAGDSTARVGLPQEEILAKDRAAAVGETTGPVTALEIADTVPPAAPEAAIELEEEDPLSDINVSLAYERFDEAEETVKKAIAANPDEHKLKLKLLEVYYAAGNNAAFEQYAPVLQSAVDGTGPLWHSVLAMWQAMSPHRALFAPATGGEPLATAPPREFIDISSTVADTQVPPPAVGREKSRPAATAGGRTLDFDLTGVGNSSTPDRERVVDISTGNELEWDGSGPVVDLADEDHRFSTAPDREERDRTKEDSVEFDLGDIDLEVVETTPPNPIETATVEDTLGFGGPTASISPLSTPPASTIDLSIGSR